VRKCSSDFRHDASKQESVAMAKKKTWQFAKLAANSDCIDLIGRQMRLFIISKTAEPG
jgi:hypothetical protein